jgi:hypothetical protein
MISVPSGGLIIKSKPKCKKHVWCTKIHRQQGASAHRVAHPTTRRRLLCLGGSSRGSRLLHLRCAIRCLDSSHGSSSTFAYAVLPGASAPRTAHRRSRAVLPLDFSLVDRTSSCRAPSFSVTRLDYSVRGRRNFVLRPHWLRFSHVMHRDYLPRGNTGSTSSTPCAATTSSSGCIASTTHLD